MAADMRSYRIISINGESEMFMSIYWFDMVEDIFVFGMCELCVSERYVIRCI